MSMPALATTASASTQPMALGTSAIVPKATRVTPTSLVDARVSSLDTWILYLILGFNGAWILTMHYILDILID